MQDALKETTVHGIERVRSDQRRHLPESGLCRCQRPDCIGRTAGSQRRSYTVTSGSVLPYGGGLRQNPTDAERAQLATLGVDNRSTATTILAVRALIELQGDRLLTSEARKLLSFTDNRQDASLQAGDSTTLPRSLCSARLFTKRPRQKKPRAD